MASASVKTTDKIILEWVRLIQRHDKHYMAKAMDTFYSLAARDQKMLLKFFEGEVKNPKWEERLEDSTQYASVIRSILFYYSGRKDLSQPCKEDFAALLAKFLRTEYKKVIKEEIEEEAKDEFSSELGAI